MEEKKYLKAIQETKKGEGKTKFTLKSLHKTMATTTPNYNVFL